MKQVMLDEPIEIIDTSWIALREASLDSIVQTLNLHPVRELSFNEASEIVFGNSTASQDDWPNLNNIFVTSFVGGWRLCIGDYLGAGPHKKDPDDQRTSFKTIAKCCERLSKNNQSVFAFTDQPQLDWYSWMFAREGKLERQVVYEDGEFLVSRGAETEIEKRLRSAFIPDEIQEKWVPDVDTVARIARAWSVDANRSQKRLRNGWLCATPRSKHTKSVA